MKGAWSGTARDDGTDTVHGPVTAAVVNNGDDVDDDDDCASSVERQGDEIDSPVWLRS